MGDPGLDTSAESVGPAKSGVYWFCPLFVLGRMTLADTCSLFCSSAVLDPTVGHTMDVLSPFISVLCHSD